MNSNATYPDVSNLNNAPLFNSKITKNYIEYLKNNHPDIDTNTLLKHAGMTVNQLDDEGHWFTQDQISRFHEKLIEQAGDPDIARKVGQFTALSKSYSLIQQFTRGFINPASAYRLVGKAFRHMTRHGTLETRNLGSGSIELTFRLTPGIDEHPSQCKNRWGTFEAIGKLFTGNFAQIEHPVCLHYGGDHCRYIITLEKTPAYFLRKIRNYSILGGLVTCPIFLFTLPFMYGVLSISACVSLVLGISLYAEHLGKKDITDSIKSEGELAGRLMDQINLSYDNALLVQEIGQACSSILDTSDLLHYVIGIMEKRLDYDRGLIMMANKERTRLVHSIDCGYKPEMKKLIQDMKFPVTTSPAKGVFTEVFIDQQPFLVNNVTKANDNVSKETLELLKTIGSHSSLCVPIVYECVTEGILLVDNLEPKRLLNQSDLNLLMGMATSVGISINNARAYQKIREGEEWFRSLSENSPDVVYTLGRDGSFTYVNPAAEKIFGYQVCELINRFPVDLAKKEDIGNFIELFKHMRDEGGTVREAVGTVIHKDNSERLINISGAPNLDAEGNTIGIVGTIKDITEREKAEEALRESEERFRGLSENAPFGISVMKPDGVFEYFNSTFTEIFGYTLEDLPDMEAWFDAVYTDSSCRDDIVSFYRKNVIEYSEIGKKEEKKLIIECKNGSEKLIYIRAVIIENRKQLLTYEDITEHRKLEDQLLQAQKMEAIGTLAGGTAHDFNNLLMTILGQTSLMLLDLKPDHPHYSKLKSIEEQTKSGADLTRQLLGFARGGKYETKPTELSETLTKTSSMFARTKKDITIHRTYDADPWIVEIDVGQIEQVLLNLYVNASQAMPGGGDLFIETRNVTLSENFVAPYSVIPGKYVKISIADTGTGMDEETKKRIFEPFFTTKEMGRGTGLGLASAYGIIGGHNGIITVKTKKGYGTTFDIYLPASEKRTVYREKVTDELIKGEETILLVDDEEMIISVNTEILEMLGYEVCAVRSGEKAVELYRSKKDEIDVVILDMIMPGMSGKETFELLRRINPQVPIILSSGYSVTDQATKIMDQGCSAFIQKPFSISDLSKKLRNVLEKGKGSSLHS